MGWIKNRIDAEYRKHKKLDWSELAEIKIKATINEKIDELLRSHVKNIPKFEIEELKQKITGEGK